MVIGFGKFGLEGGGSDEVVWVEGEEVMNVYGWKRTVGIEANRAII